MMREKIRSVQYRLQKKQDEMKKMAQRRRHNPEGVSVPVFLVGCGRSGTSMFIWQLEKSWQIELYNEDHPAAFDVYRLRDYDVIEGLVEKSQAPFTLLKPILDTVQTMRLLNHFPGSKAIFAFRHYTDVINSSLKRFGTYNRLNHVKGWMAEDFAEFDVAPPPETSKLMVRALWQDDLSPEEGAALYWLFYNRLYYDLGLEEDERVYLVRYESLVTEPRKQFEQVIRFLGAEFEEQMVEGVHAKSINKNDSPPLRPAILAACEEMYEQMTQDAA
jgi:hypothetical protein